MTPRKHPSAVLERQMEYTLREKILEDETEIASWGNSMEYEQLTQDFPINGRCDSQ